MLSGCANTSSTKIRREADGTISIDSAKVLSFERLEYERRTTNESERIVIVNYRSEPLPAVTEAQGKREAAVIEKAGGAVGDGGGCRIESDGGAMIATSDAVSSGEWSPAENGVRTRKEVRVAEVVPWKAQFWPVNGIRTIPHDQQGWIARLRAAVRGRFAERASVAGLEYFTFASLKSLFQERWVRRLSSELKWELLSRKSRGEDTRFIGIGHSNGADIWCQCLHEMRDVAASLGGIEELHLFSPAVEHDFDKNHLNAALKNGDVQRLYLYASRGDQVLKYLARPSRFLLGKFGYGYLGYQAAVDEGSLKIAAEVRERVTIVVDNECGHGDWFLPPRFVRMLSELFRSVA